MQFNEEKLNEVLNLVKSPTHNIYEIAEVLKESKETVLEMLVELERRGEIYRVSSRTWLPYRKPLYFKHGSSKCNLDDEEIEEIKRHCVPQNRQLAVTKFKWLSDQLENYRAMVFSSKAHKSSSLIAVHLLDQEINNGKNVVIFDVNHDIHTLNKEVFDDGIDLSNANVVDKKFLVVDEFVKELECLKTKPDIIFVNRIEEVFKGANSCLLGAFLYNYAYENDAKIIISGLLTSQDDGFLLPKYCDYSQYRCMDLLSRDSDILIDCYD